VALEFDKFFYVSYGLYIVQWTNFIPSNLRAIILIFLLGCGYIFNIFTFMCHKFLHFCAHYFVIHAFLCVGCILLVYNMLCLN
jgi:hypothetical protein